MYVGKAYASELAKRGLNIVLVSRTPHKLQNVAAEITEKYKVRTKIVDIDFTTEKEVYERIVKETDGLEVGPAQYISFPVFKGPFDYARLDPYK